MDTLERDQLRADTEATMGDRCSIGVDFGGSDGAEGHVPAWDYGGESICGFRELGARQLAARGLDLTVTAAELRLPADSWVDSRVRIRLNERAGVPIVPPQYYTVEGNGSRGISASVLLLKQFEGDPHV